jgi:hypothetical protein
MAMQGMLNSLPLLVLLIVEGKRRNILLTISGRHMERMTSKSILWTKRKGEHERK